MKKPLDSILIGGLQYLGIAWLVGSSYICLQLFCSDSTSTLVMASCGLSIEALFVSCICLSFTCIEQSEADEACPTQVGAIATYICVCILYES